MNTSPQKSLISLSRSNSMDQNVVDQLVKENKGFVVNGDLAAKLFSTRSPKPEKTLSRQTDSQFLVDESMMIGTQLGYDRSDVDAFFGPSYEEEEEEESIELPIHGFGTTLPATNYAPPFNPSPSPSYPQSPNDFVPAFPWQSYEQTHHYYAQSTTTSLESMSSVSSQGSFSSQQSSGSQSISSQGHSGEQSSMEQKVYRLETRNSQAAKKKSPTNKSSSKKSGPKVEKRLLKKKWTVNEVTLPADEGQELLISSNEFFHMEKLDDNICIWNLNIQQTKAKHSPLTTEQKRTICELITVLVPERTGYDKVTEIRKFNLHSLLTDETYKNVYIACFKFHIILRLCPADLEQVLNKNGKREFKSASSYQFSYLDIQKKPRESINLGDRDSLPNTSKYAITKISKSYQPSGCQPTSSLLFGVMFCPSVWFSEAIDFLTFAKVDRHPVQPFHFTLTSQFPEKFRNTVLNMFGKQLFFKDTVTLETYKCELRFPNNGVAFFENSQLYLSMQHDVLLQMKSSPNYAFYSGTSCVVPKATFEFLDEVEVVANNKPLENPIIDTLIPSPMKRKRTYSTTKIEITESTNTNTLNNLNNLNTTNKPKTLNSSKAVSIPSHLNNNIIINNNNNNNNNNNTFYHDDTENLINYNQTILKNNITLETTVSTNTATNYTSKKGRRFYG